MRWALFLILATLRSATDCERSGDVMCWKEMEEGGAGRFVAKRSMEGGRVIALW